MFSKRENCLFWGLKWTTVEDVQPLQLLLSGIVVAGGGGGH